MKKIFAAFLAVSLVFLVSCSGVSESEYNALMKEKNALAQQYQQQAEQLHNAQQELEQTREEHAFAQGEIERLQSELEQANGETQQLHSQIEKLEQQNQELSQKNTAATGTENKSAPSPAAGNAPIVSSPATQTIGRMVWVTSSGKKYHTSSSCSGMKNPIEISLEDAQAKGYQPCKKCC